METVATLRGITYIDDSKATNLDAMVRAIQSFAEGIHLIAGGRDKLTPPEASNYLAQAMPAARVVEVEGAAHAPFLSHPEIFVEQVKSFLHE